MKDQEVLKTYLDIDKDRKHLVCNMPKCQAYYLQRKNLALVKGDICLLNTRRFYGFKDFCRHSRKVEWVASYISAKGAICPR